MAYSAAAILPFLVPLGLVLFSTIRQQSSIQRIPGPPPSSWLLGNMLQLFLPPYGYYCIVSINSSPRAYSNMRKSHEIAQKPQKKPCFSPARRQRHRALTLDVIRWICAVAATES
ncbi:hypothetical protein FB451DRAFT_120518 [Mycena latifolia]|nr:hypothetical protein FB451DRAFT_120518 [Mycena latifolia]